MLMKKRSTYKLQWTKAGKKGLESLHKDDVAKVKEELRNLLTWIETGEGKKPDVKKLKGALKSLYRLRVGKVRVIFSISMPESSSR